MIDAARDVMAAALGKICEGFPHDGRTFTILKGFPEELCCVVVATASEREAPLRQIATDFGISEGCLHFWLKTTDREDGVGTGGGEPSPNSPLTMSPRTMSHIDVFGAVTAIESFSGCPRDLEEPLMPEEEWIDAVAAAERYHCSTSKIRRWIKQGELEMRLKTSVDSDGRWVFTTWLRVRDLDDVSGVTAHKEHVRKIRATAQPFTDAQNAALRKVFLAHLLEREAKRKRAGIGCATAK